MSYVLQAKAGASQSAIVLAAMDKFRSSASARDLGDAVARVARVRGWNSDVQPMSDGGEGFIEAFPGEVVTVEVPGPLNGTVEARIKLSDLSTVRLGVLEVADVVGRSLLAHPTSAEATAVTSAGVGHLILAAARLGVGAVLVGCGGTATSDGGLGCYRVLRDAGGLPVAVTAATDVTAHFSGALGYAHQKGVDLRNLDVIESRLANVRRRYLREQGVDVECLERAGAAGGIPGAIAALGGTLISGFDAVADSVGLIDRIGRASLVVTGEGRFDAGSLEGKVTVAMAALVDKRSELLVVCGSVEPAAGRMFLDRFPGTTLVGLEDRFGTDRSRSDVLECLATVVADHLQHWRTGAASGSPRP